MFFCGWVLYGRVFPPGRHVFYLFTSRWIWSSWEASTFGNPVGKGWPAKKPFGFPIYCWEVLFCWGNLRVCTGKMEKVWFVAVFCLCFGVCLRYYAPMFTTFFSGDVLASNSSTDCFWWSLMEDIRLTGFFPHTTQEKGWIKNECNELECLSVWATQKWTKNT